jgi:hypothetical protein
MRKPDQRKLVVYGLYLSLGIFAFFILVTEKATAGSKQGALLVTAMVRPYLQMQLLHQERAVTVREEDVWRGFLDIPSASRLAVKTNAAQGIRIVFQAQDGPFAVIEVHGVQTPIRLSRGGVYVLHLPEQRAVSLDLSYRFFIASPLNPGSYPWPVAISVEPI